MGEGGIRMKEYGESSYRRNPAKDPRELERLVLTYADSLVRYAYGITRRYSTIIQEAGR